VSPRLLAAVPAALMLTACGAQEQLSPEAARGKQVYQAQCIACHNPDPSKAGSIGPEVKGVPPAVVRTKVIEGTYPSGYTPKRPTKIMQAMPQLAPEVNALTAYLR
jgi:mono/diheme cytochrome c family protein